ncbi:MAG TPA: DUF4129 domain-containing protein [Thermoanaerobaculia bacterium]
MTTRPRRKPKNAVDLIDESFHDLRRASSAGLAAYAVGAVPFLLGLLYFWTDMSASAFAGAHVAESSLGLALLYVGLKLGQTVFASRLRESVAGEAHARWTLPRLAVAAGVQASVQPTGLFLIPISAMLVLPFVPVLAFYENVTILGDGRLPLGETIRMSARRSRLWRGQNSAALAILLLFWVAVFANVAVGFVTLPYLVRMFLGVESVFTRSAASLLNSTFLGTALAATFLLTSPLVKAVYVRRCFEAGSIESGEDLRVAWRRDLASRLGAIGGAAILILLASAPLRASENPGDVPAPWPAPASRVSPEIAPAELDRAIRAVLQKRVYSWRLPRSSAAEAPEENALARRFGWIGKWIDKFASTMTRWWNSLRAWLRRLQPTPAPGRTPSAGWGWLYSSQGFILLALAAAACTLVLLVLRRRWRRSAETETIALVGVAVPDTNETGSEERPEAEWRERARAYLAGGDLRQAARALYLGLLAILVARAVITPARFKSNRDYEREVARRQRARPSVRELFSQSVRTFEAIWYGRHPATLAAVQLLDQNLERIREQLES